MKLSQNCHPSSFGSIAPNNTDFILVLTLHYYIRLALFVGGGVDDLLFGVSSALDLKLRLPMILFPFLLLLCGVDDCSSPFLILGVDTINTLYVIININLKKKKKELL